MERAPDLDQRLAEVGEVRAVVGVGLEAGVDRRAERGRQLRARLGEALDRLADRPRGRGRAQLRDRVEPGPELVEGEAERVDVGGRAGAGAGRLLRRHVGERADDLAGGGQRRSVVERGDPEVGEQRALREPALDAARADRADEDVVGLDVAVDDAGLVGVLERGAELGADVGEVAVAERLGRGELAQVRSLDELADEVGACPGGCRARRG